MSKIKIVAAEKAVKFATKLVAKAGKTSKAIGLKGQKAIDRVTAKVAKAQAGADKKLAKANARLGVATKKLEAVKAKFSA